ncbi:SGNH/GDSL hydrolase family protein [bacterium]|nr:SGNH/GDSL hydrolase family protein [bacterium]
MKKGLIPILTASLIAILTVPGFCQNDQLTTKSQEQIDWESKVSKRFLRMDAFRFVSDEPGLPRVLIIGDSISIGYTDPLRKRLAGKANVHRIPANGSHTGTGLEKLDEWLGEKPWDLIAFNWGLHEVTHMVDGKANPSGERRNSHEVYEKNLEEIVKRLKQTRAKLIWISTTFVPEGSKARVHREEIPYNEIAARIMKRHQIPTIDLHSPTTAHAEEWQLPQNVHFKPEGSEALGEIVAKGIEKALREQEPASQAELTTP